jgi:hypothetical protein
MAKRSKKSEEIKYPRPEHLPRATGGGSAEWTVGAGAPLDTIKKLTELFIEDRTKLNDENQSEDKLVIAACYWMGYPLWLEQVGYWWAREAPRYSAYCALNHTHHRATEVLMQAAEECGIDSAPLMESAQWCRQLLADPTHYRSTGEIWPMCLESYANSLPPGAWEAMQKGYAAFCRLSARLENKAENNQWSNQDSPKQWAKRFGFSVDTLNRRFKDGTIRFKKLSPKSYCINVDDLPK